MVAPQKLVLPPTDPPCYEVLPLLEGSASSSCTHHHRGMASRIILQSFSHRHMCLPLLSLVAIEQEEVAGWPLPRSPCALLPRDTLCHDDERLLLVGSCYIRGLN